MKHWSTLAICTFTAYSASGFESFEKKAVEIKPPYHLASGLLGSSFSGPDMLSVQAQYLEQMLSSVKGYPRVKMQLPENSATNAKKKIVLARALSGIQVKVTEYLDGHNELTFTSSRQKSKQYHFSVESLSPYEEKLAMLIKLQVNTGFRIVFKPETNAFTISIGRTPIILVESHLSVEAMPRFTMPGLLALNERNLESLGNAMTCYSLVESRRQNTVVCANGQLIRNNDGLFVYALGSPAPSMPENLGSLLDYGQVQGWLSGDYALLFRAGIPDEVRQIGEIDNQPEPCDGKSRQKRRRKRKQGTSQSASQSASSTHTRRYDKPPSSKRKRVKGGGSNNGGNNPNERPTNYDKESPTSEPDEEALLREQLKNLEILIRKNEQHREYLKKDDPTIDPRQALSNRWVRDRIGPIIDGLKQQRQEAQERLSQILDPSSTTQKPETKEN